jgi:hypothetical protein
MSVAAVGCVDNESRYQEAYDQEYREAYDEAYAPAYAVAYDAAFAAAESVSYDSRRQRLVASRAFSYDSITLALVAVAGMFVGFVAQFVMYTIARRTPLFVDSLDKQLHGLSTPRIAIRPPSSGGLAALVLLFGCLAATGCGDGGYARGRVDGQRAGLIAGEQAGRLNGEREGQARGTESGDMRAVADARMGRLPEIYIAPLFFAAVVGVLAGVWLQRAIIRALRAGAPVSARVAILTVPGLWQTRTFQAWRAQHAADVHRRLGLIAGSPKALLPSPLIDVQNTRRSLSG